jgi:hypothetical protein
MGYSLNYLLTADTMRTHRARWYVYAGGNGTPRTKIPHTAQMRGSWSGWDVTCSCGGWESRTGGANRTYVESVLWDHRFAEQTAKAEGLPNSDPATWPEDVLCGYLERHRRGTTGNDATTQGDRHVD